MGARYFLAAIELHRIETISSNCNGVLTQTCFDAFRSFDELGMHPVKLLLGEAV
jgi:hypothetical protein